MAPASRDWRNDWQKNREYHEAIKSKQKRNNDHFELNRKRRQEMREIRRDARSAMDLPRSIVDRTEVAYKTLKGEADDYVEGEGEGEGDEDETLSYSSRILGIRQSVAPEKGSLRRSNASQGWEVASQIKPPERALWKSERELANREDQALRGPLSPPRAEENGLFVLDEEKEHEEKILATKPPRTAPSAASENPSLRGSNSSRGNESRRSNGLHSQKKPHGRQRLNREVDPPNREDQDLRGPLSPLPAAKHGISMGAAAPQAPALGQTWGQASSRTSAGHSSRSRRRGRPGRRARTSKTWR